MSHLSAPQLLTLKAAILAEVNAAFVTARTQGNNAAMATYYNEQPGVPYVVYKSSETVAAVGLAVNYVSFEALTTANLEKINTFTRLNMSAFSPAKADIRSFWANVFSGALGGQGQATRDALEALWRRNASRAEQMFATGTGTTLSPATLGWEGMLDGDHIREALAS